MMCRRRVRKLVEEHYWDGFFAYLGDGLGPGRPLSYVEAPSWWDDVADVAYRSGWEYAVEAVANIGTRRFGGGYRATSRRESGPTPSGRRGDVWRVAQEGENPHPAPFPVGLPGRAIETVAPSSVLDPFAGSGTTLRAAKDAGVRAVGIELSERYCELAVARLAQESLFGGERDAA